MRYILIICLFATMLVSRLVATSLSILMAISSQNSTLEIPLVAIRWPNANLMDANKKCKCDNYTRNNEEKSNKRRLKKEKMSDFAKNTAHNERRLLNISYICSVAEGLRQT